MNHDGGLLGVVAVGIDQLKPLGHREVKLNGAELPGAADGVLDVEVDLGTVERAVAFVDLVFHALVLQGAGQCVGGRFPNFIGADVIFGLGGQLDMVVGKAEGGVELLDKVDDADDLAFDLVGTAEKYGRRPG